MSILLPLTLALATAAPGADPAAPPSVEASLHFHDGSILNRVKLRDSVEIATRYGKLSVPMSDVRRIEFGHRVSVEVAAKIRLAVRRLGHDQQGQRDAAENELGELGKSAYPALQIAAQSADKEVARRARSLLDKLRQTVPEDELQFRGEDVVHTLDCVLTGRIVTAGLKVQTQKFGDVTIQLADLKTAHSMATTSTQVAVDAAPFAASPDRWFDTGVALDAGTNTILTAAGSVELTPQLEDKLQSGPDGCDRAGKTFGVSAGTLMGRIGNKGEPFVIGKRCEMKLDQGGRLQVFVVPTQEKPAPTGSYQLTITTGFGLAVNPARNPELPKPGDCNLAGVIMINGKAGAELEVCLFPVNKLSGKSITGTTDKDGTFELLEMHAGDYNVVVRGKNVPAQYADPKTTPLTFRVQKGDNIGSFDVK